MTQNIAITSSSKLRKKYVDALKGFLMLSIIAGHLGNYHAIRAIVFVYHVPAFFLISGFFFNIDSGKLKKRMIQLLKPYLSTSVIICVLLFVKNFLKFLLHKESKDILSYALKLISSIIYGSGSRIDFFDVNFISIGAVWFLLALAWCSLFTHLIETMLNHTAAKISAVVILFAVSYISSKYIWLPLSIQSGMCSLLYFYSGFLLKKYNIIEYI